MPVHRSQPGDPTWEIAALFPAQGAWSELEYLSLDTNRLIEFSDGTLEVLEMPTELHQLIAFFLCTRIRNPESGNPAGIALMAPFRIRLFAGKFREPDVMFILNENRERRQKQYWESADLVIEVVSDDDPKRDLVLKRSEYAQAKISEYWIVDPRDRSIRVLTLDNDGSRYRESGCYSDGQTAQSVLLNEFRVAVSEVFDQGQGV